VSISLLSLLFGHTVWAQKDAGSIAGTIRDASGATVPLAKVTVTEVDNGTSLVTSSSNSGDYVASPLPIGRYSLKVEKTGFKTAVTEAIELQVQQRAVVDLALQVGTISEEVTVTNIVPLLETETSELGQVVDNSRMVNLPLNGRNFAQLAQLSAGVAPSEPGARNAGSYGFGSNGGRPYQNNILLDGIAPSFSLTTKVCECGKVRPYQPPYPPLLKLAGTSLKCLISPSQRACSTVMAYQLTPEKSSIAGSHRLRVRALFAESRLATM